MTARQQEIKQLLDEGMTVREIAADLGITRNGVYQHIQSMRRRGDLPSAYTPTGRSARKATTITTTPALEKSEADLAIRLLLNEINRTRDELDRISRRLSAVLPD